jgi:long-chain acyl-CoA synthetase
MINHHATALNLSSVLEHYAALTPDRVAVTCAGQHTTYGQLNAAAAQVAAGLIALGVAPGDHVALSCPNVTWFPIAYFGILKAGAAVVPLNVLLKPREIAYHLKDSDAVALIAFEGTSDLPIARMARAACDEAGVQQLIIITADPSADAPVSSATTLGTVMRGQPTVFEPRRRRPSDTAVILYTSGTTGRSKGAELTHENMLLNAVATHDMIRPACKSGFEQDVALVTLPLFHSTAQTCQMNSGLYGGLRLVLMPRFDPAQVLQTIVDEQVGFWIGVPTMYWMLLEHVNSSSADPTAIAKCLRVCISGGAPMPLDVLQRFEKTFGVRVLEGYGLSETAPVVSFNQLYRPTKPGTVGFPIFGVDVRCVDDEGRPVADGERGEIVVRGPSVMRGYYNRPEATEEATRNGWFHTGDIGVFDPDGYLSIVDRKKDMILRSGYNVYPRELEEVLLTHPAVAMAAVVGVPDPRVGEEVKAYIVRRPGTNITEEMLVDWAREQFASYKYPRVVEFRDSLPISATGKVLKRELKGV